MTKAGRVPILSDVLRTTMSLDAVSELWFLTGEARGLKILASS